MPPKRKEQEPINITVSDEGVSLVVNGVLININKADQEKPRKESPDDIVDWEATPTGDRPITRREQRDKEWDLYCRSSQ